MVNKTKVRKLNRPIFTAMLLLSVLSACTKASYYSETHVFSDVVWGAGEQPVFTFDMQDSVSLYDLSFVLRLNNDYDYQNVWILMHTTRPGGMVSTDTINLQVFDERGRWLGKKSGSTYTFTGIFALNHRFESVGKHNIRMEHAVMNPELRGVMDMSLLVDYAKN
jgi:gliding motility-associated lipoprotein GldH